MTIECEIVSVFALANDYAKAKGLDGSSSDYWRVYEAAAAIADADEPVFMTGDTLHTADWRWSFRDPPRTAYKPKRNTNKAPRN